METGEKLFGGELLLVIGAGDFKHQKDGIDVEDLEFIEFLVIAISQKAEDADNRDPDERL